MTKYIVPSLLMLVGAAILGNAVIATIYANLSTGIRLTYAIGAMLIASGLCFHRLPTWLIATGVIGILIVTVCIAALFLYGNADTATYTEDVALVLGAGVQGDKPTKSLQNRLDCAVSYHRQNPHAMIVVSGAQGPQEAVTEAYAMEQYLIDKGVPADRILKEEAAISTSENFRFAKELLDAYFDRPYTPAFVTTNYHMYRASVNAARVGFDDAARCHSATP